MFSDIETNKLRTFVFRISLLKKILRVEEMLSAGYRKIQKEMNIVRVNMWINLNKK